MYHKYIDKNTFEIVDNVFEVDEQIADTISILNKKGYLTLYSCSGHVKDPRLYEKYPIEKADDCCDSFIIDDKSILIPYLSTRIYILFDKEYSFKTLPKNFIIENLDCKSIIFKEIDFYINNIKRKSNDIQKEINESNNDLLEWAQNL